MKSHSKLITIFFFTLFLLISCSRSYSFHLFSYPPDCQPHKDNWTYFGKIILWDPFGKNIANKGLRKVEIYIYDKTNKEILNDELEFDCASLEREVVWNEFENFQISLFEIGNVYADDEYNKILIKEGRRHLITLNYYWNGTKFIKK